MSFIIAVKVEGVPIYLFFKLSVKSARNFNFTKMVNFSLSSKVDNVRHDHILLNRVDEEIAPVLLSPVSESEVPADEEPGARFLDDYNVDEEPLFSPPLFIQRYCYVEDVISKYGEEMDLKSIVDFGCAEMKFLVRSKNGRKFQRIIGVDRNEFLVGSYCRKIQPGGFEFNREQPLKVGLLCCLDLYMI